MRMILIAALISMATFAAGILLAPHLASTSWGEVNLRAIGTFLDYWAERYQTFIGVVVAVIAAALSVSAATKQNDIAERQFLSGQMQSAITDRGTIQFVIAQLSELRSQRRIFENNIAFLENEGDRSTGWMNGGNTIRTAFLNMENYRTLVSANTSKFLGLTAVRTELINRIDAIVNAQDLLKEAFMNWANTNRSADAPMGRQSPERDNYHNVRRSILTMFDELAPAASAAITELNKKIDQTDKDIAELQSAIDRKLPR